MSKFKKYIFRFFLILFTSGIVLSCYHMITYIINENKINHQMDQINSIVEMNEIKDTDKTEIIKSEETISKTDPYWDYIYMNLIDVNFNELKNINNHIKGWIKVNGTNINYPFVQTTNNSYYLTHSLDKSYNSAGWVFLDYRNNLSNLNNKNTILYAHGRLDKTMFGSLKNILTTDWLNNKTNHVVKLSTEYENTLWQVFSVYRIPTTSDYIKTNFSDDNEFKSFAEMILNRSVYNFNTSVSSSDRILTLSTCYNKTDKVVLHAKLIKRKIR